MSSLEDYFKKQAYIPKWFLGDRIFGYWNKIPFIGTVGNDTRYSEEDGPFVIVLLDLPILYKGKINHVVIVKHKDIKSKLQVLEEIK